MWVIRAVIHKMLNRTANWDRPRSNCSSRSSLICVYIACLMSRPFWQSTNVPKFRTFTIPPKLINLFNFVTMLAAAHEPLPLYLIETLFTASTNRADPDQAALVRATWSGPTLFSYRNMVYPTLVDWTSNFFVLCTNVKVYLFDYS